MIGAPFSAGEATSVLGTFATIVIAIGGIALMLTGPSKYAKRALLLGVVLACMAGSARAIFA